MNKKERYAAGILDDWINRLQSGETTIEKFRSDYPDIATEYRDLVNLADELLHLRVIEAPRKEFLIDARARILKSVGSSSKIGIKKAPDWFKIFGLRKLPAYSYLIIFVILVTFGVGITTASAQALPGDPLYPVKLGIETGQLALSFSPEADISLLTRNAERRVLEIQNLITLRRYEDIEIAASELQEILNELEGNLSEASFNGIDFEALKNRIGHHIEVLSDVVKTAPESAQSGLSNALDKSEHSLEVIEQIQSGGSPSELAPGQIKKTTTPSAEPQIGEDDHGRGEDHRPDKDKTPGPPENPPGKDKDKSK